MFNLNKPQPTTPSTVYRHKKISLPWLKIIIATLIIAAATFGILWFTTDGFRDKNSPEYIIDKVSTHILLPDETPEITTVDKAIDLTSRPFFSAVRDGDKILIFGSSARIMIYRPSENILINVGPIVDDSATIQAEDNQQ